MTSAHPALNRDTMGYIKLFLRGKTGHDISKIGMCRLNCQPYLKRAFRMHCRLWVSFVGALSGAFFFAVVRHS
jgi:hypothetical protein